jgi:cell division septum initiation protein DivIVA
MHVDTSVYHSSEITILLLLLSLALSFILFHILHTCAPTRSFAFRWLPSDLDLPFSRTVLASVMATFHDYTAQAGSFEPSSLTFALQALLHRHESYMAEAEEDRYRLVSSIDDLEREKQQVQAENARIIEENRSLLEQLDNLNQAVAESDDHVKSLTVTLENTESELRRLTVAATRAAELEAQLALMETEQSKLQESLVSVQEDEKSAVQRWKQAESTLRDLHDQVDRIEKEAREERDRHTELVQRMERKRAVERELDNAAGRLKGAAAASELSRNAGGTNVVSRFVKDILQDNANLQVGIMELRDMLHSSNEEVQNLREQVISHQPLAGADEEDNVQPRPSTTLSEELRAKEERRVSQELHIHHHFHTPTPAPGTKKEKGPLNRRVKKRRPALLSPVAMHSATRAQSPRRGLHRSQSSGSSMSTILSQTSVSIPPHSSSRRWSSQSHAPDSLASSPRSAFRTSSIFDRVERGADFSQPTSPESTVFSSPLMQARNLKGIDMPFRPFGGFDNHDAPDDLSALEDDIYSRQDFLNTDNVTREPDIPEESEPSPSAAYFSPMGEPLTTTEDDIFTMHVQPSSLRRSSSHDSLLSVSVAGMDIHTPTSRHKRMGDWHPGMRIPRRILSPSVELLSTPPVISAPAITVDRATSSEHKSQSLLASMAAGNHTKSDAASVVSTDSTSTGSTATLGPRKASTLGRRMGGWVLGRWGIAAVSSDNDSENPTNSPNTSLTSSPSTSAPKSPDPLALRFRYPGVNQKGPIMGLRPPPPAPISIHAQSIDENLLRESLAEDNG